MSPPACDRKFLNSNHNIAKSSVPGRTAPKLTHVTTFAKSRRFWFRLHNDPGRNLGLVGFQLGDLRLPDLAGDHLADTAGREPRPATGAIRVIVGKPTTTPGDVNEWDAVYESTST
jgi:hypothetical protein